MNEKKKTTLTIVAAVLLVIGLVIIFMVSCNGNEDRKDGEIITQAVTNADGEVVTNANGEVVTEAVLSTETTKSESTQTTKSNNSENSSQQNSNSGLKQPNVVKNLAVKTDATTATLSWSSNGECTGYIVSYTRQGQENWVTHEVTTKTQSVITNLSTETAYTFRVITYNGSLNTGYTKSKEAKVDGVTKTDTSAKYITIEILLPETQAKDTLEIYVLDELVDSREVTCDGSTITFETPKKYEGKIKVSAKLLTLGYDEYVTTDTGSATIKFSDNYIDYVDGGMD